MTPDFAEKLNAPLATQRLIFEPLTAAHAGTLFSLMQDDRTYTWISGDPPKSVESLSERWARLERRIIVERNETWLVWAARRTDDGAYVGKYDVAIDADNVAINVGMMIFPTFWNRGYASEGLAVIIKHLTYCGINQFRATVTVGHDASARVLEKAGFVRTRIIPDNDTIRGVKCDDLEYVLCTVGDESVSRRNAFWRDAQ